MEDVFADLKARREALGLSLEDIFRRTRINPSYLEALEAGRFDVLPRTYVRLFLKAYAQEMGMDPQEALDRYEACAHPPSDDSRQRPFPSTMSMPLLTVTFAVVLIAGIGTVVVVHRGAPTAPRAVADSNVSALSRTAAPDAGSQPGREVLRNPAPALETPQAFQQENTGGGAGFAPAPGAGAPATEHPETGADPGAAGAVPPQPVVLLPGRMDSASTDTGHAQTTPDFLEERVVDAYALAFSPGPQDTLLALEGRAADSVRVSVSADGKRIFNGILSPGTPYRWTASYRLLIEVDGASALDLSLQGHPLTPRGDPGRKHRFFISRSSIWVEEIDRLSPSSPPPPTDR